MSTSELVLQELAQLPDDQQQMVLQYAKELREQQQDDPVYEQKLHQLLAERIAEHEATPEAARDADEVIAELKKRFGYS
ncbi:MAG: hypothetical protein AAFQ98_05030 [Bacteroidota bacterium]